MYITKLKSKIHLATVIQAELNDIGGITIDSALLEAAQIEPYEKVEIMDIDNDRSFDTYVVAGKKGDGMIALNGACAKYASQGDRIMVMCYANVDIREADALKARILFVDGKNRLLRVERG